MCINMDTCVPWCVKVRGQLSGMDSFLPPCGFQGLDSGCQGWVARVFLPIELSHWLSTL